MWNGKTDRQSVKQSSLLRHLKKSFKMQHCHLHLSTEDRVLFFDEHMAFLWVKNYNLFVQSKESYVVCNSNKF